MMLLFFYKILNSVKILNIFRLVLLICFAPSIALAGLLFDPAISSTLEVSPGYLEPININNDGYVDFAYSASGSMTVYVSAGDGTGAFSSFASLTNETTIHAFTVADMDRDGFDDIIITRAVPGYFGGEDPLRDLAIILYGGSASLRADMIGYTPIPRATTMTSGLLHGSDQMPEVATGMHGLVVGITVMNDSWKSNYATGLANMSKMVSTDLNNDGYVDIVGISPDSNQLVIIWGNTFYTQSVKATGIQPIDIALGYINADDSPDIIFAHRGEAKLGILWGDSNPDLINPVFIDVASTQRSLTLSDFNMDSFDDIAYISNSADQVSILISNGIDGFDTDTDIDTAVNPSLLCSTDINNDGKPDLVLSYLDTNSISTYPRYLLESMHGNCNIIRIVTDIGSDNPDQLIEMYRFWMAYEQAQSLLGLWISSGPVYVGVSEICYLGVAGGKKPYYVTNIPEHNIFMVNKKDDSNFGMTYDIGFFKIIGKNIGDTSLSVTDSSQPEQIVQVPVHVVESVSPSLSPV